MAAASFLQSQLKASFRWSADTPSLSPFSTGFCQELFSPDSEWLTSFHLLYLSFKCHLLRKIWWMMLSKIPPENLYQSPLLKFPSICITTITLIRGSWKARSMPGFITWKSSTCFNASMNSCWTNENSTWLAHAPMLMHMPSLCPHYFHYVEIRD